MQMSPEMRKLAQVHGVATEYTGWQGEAVQVPAETVTAVLAAMGVDASSAPASADALQAHRERRWARMLPPCVVTRQGSASSCWVHIAPTEPVEVLLELETGETVGELRQLGEATSPPDLPGGPLVERNFALEADLPLGYHRLRARSAGRESFSTVIVTPSCLGLPERLGAHRTWGFATQLYSVRSSGSWGIGDLADLTDLAVWSAARLGAGFVLVNPLHAGEPVAPIEPSPYLPASRRFGSPLYLRVERVPEYAALGPEQRERIQLLLDDLRHRLGATDLIDRDASWAAKREALRLVHAVPRSAGRELDYRAFRARGGAALDGFATWSAIAVVHGGDSSTWPEELRDPSSPAVHALAEELAGEVDFQCWCQWVLDEQLQVVQAKSVGAGMSLGVMHDLAVGVHPGGADTWAAPGDYASSIQVGAPPDAFNQVGQDWSQPPLRPDRLEELGYAPFRELIAAVLRHAGGIRVDHVIGLFRLWWIPAGRPPSEGTYVTYDHEAMVGVLALEAHRAGAVVVGEDLGTVEPSAREYLLERGILGTSVLWFERDQEGEPLAAERWRELCLASVTTHDLPPTAGYLAGEHVRLRDQLGLLTRPVAEEAAADARERESWLDEVRSRGLLESDDTDQTVQALHRYLALSPARLLCVALADAVGEHRTQNQPGTTDEYPNWRVPLSGPDGQPLLLEDVLGSERVVVLVRQVQTGLLRPHAP